jgi:hypothetical protein
VAAKVHLEEAARQAPASCMILLYAVALGLVTGLVRARLRGQPYHSLPPKHMGLLFAAILLQVLAINFPATRRLIPDQLASFLLVSTQIGLLAFVWLNRSQPGFLILGGGLMLNLLVIIANGGWMPVSPQVAAKLFPSPPADTLQTGMRVGWSKDILLSHTETYLWWLSDCLLLPAWFPQRAALSPGDILVAAAAFWALWARGGKVILYGHRYHPSSISTSFNSIEPE